MRWVSLLMPGRDFMKIGNFISIYGGFLFFDVVIVQRHVFIEV